MKRHCNSLAHHIKLLQWLVDFRCCWEYRVSFVLDDIEYWDVFLIYFLHNVLRKFAIDNLLFGTPFISCCLMYSFSQFLGCPGSMPGYCDCGVPKRCFCIKHWHQCHHASSQIIMLQESSLDYDLILLLFFLKELRYIRIVNCYAVLIFLQ